MVQMVRGVLASVTSATIWVLDPCIVRSASCAVAEPEQAARRAAQAGTDTGVGDAMGEGEGLGVGLGISLGLGVGLGERVGVGRATSGPFAVQPAMAAKRQMRTTPFLTA
jgi:hypothetical protein